jgi:hypothetical protein
MGAIVYTLVKLLGVNAEICCALFINVIIVSPLPPIALHQEGIAGVHIVVSVSSKEPPGTSQATHPQDQRRCLVVVVDITHISDSALSDLGECSRRLCPVSYPPWPKYIRFDHRIIGGKVHCIIKRDVGEMQCFLAVAPSQAAFVEVRHFAVELKGRAMVVA